MAEAQPTPDRATTDMAESSAVEARPRASKFKRFVWFTGSALLALGAAYGAGFLQRQAQLDAKDEALEQVRRELAAAEARDTASSARLDALEARRRMHLAILDFDRNNFGTAREHLLAAGASLQRQAGSDPRLGELAKALRTLELSPTSDLAAQRTSLVQLAEKFDKLRPPPPASG